MMDIEEPNLQYENQRIFSDYLSRHPIKDPHSFSFDLDMFRNQSPSTAQDIIRNPTKYYRLIRNYLEKGIFGDERKEYISKIEHFTINFEGNLGSNFVTPRGLSSRMANQLVGIQGIITRMDLTRNQLEKSVHWCQKTKSYEVKQYPDTYAPEKQFDATKTKFIKRFDDNNNPLDFEFGLSSFRNIQTVVVQELPEMAPPGLLPQSVTVILQGKHVNSIKPGDRIQMIGIYKLIPGALSKEKGIFRPFFLCLSIKPLHQVLQTHKMTARMPCPQTQLFQLFSRSIAPSIYGHQHLKKAVLLMLLGGCQKVLENGTHLRGDINVLMVGDPGTAKSQMLRWILSTVDLGIGTTGSGASGVGLTAAIVNDRQSGEKTLEAGAMVLADRGYVCIDEFDKMNEVDRVAVHQVMQQQTVTIAKAGIHCSLNARCSVIAAANPLFSQYQVDKPPTKNIGMPDSLLSRFDLIFIILDEKNPERDKKVAQRVCRNHRFAPITNAFSLQFNEDEEFIIQPVEPQSKVQQDQIYEKTAVFKSEGSQQILAQSFLKKYITYCKAHITPILSEDSITLLSALWTTLRQKDHEAKQTSHHKVLPITIRSYQTLIRLSTSHAKLRQSSTVQLYDCVEVFKLMIFCLYGAEDALDDQLDQCIKQHNLDIVIPSGKKKMKLTNYNQNELIQDEQFITNNKNIKENQQKNKYSKKKQQEELVRGMQKIQIDKDQKQIEQILKKSETVGPTRAKISETFKAIVFLKNKKREDFVTIMELVDHMKGKKIGQQEILTILQNLDKNGKVHFVQNQGKIYI